MDTFAQVTLIDVDVVSSLEFRSQKRKNITIVAVNGNEVETLGSIDLEIVSEERRIRVEAWMIKGLESSVGVPLLLGLDAHREVQSLSIKFDGRTPEVHYGAAVAAVKIEEGWLQDADGWYRREADGTWTFRWRWKGGPPAELVWNGAYIYDRKLKTDEDRDHLRKEIRSWIEQGFLVPYDEETMGEVAAILPINPVLQPGKSTAVRPACDYQELNRFVVGTSDREHNEVCSESVRRWRKYEQILLADLSKAYMRVRISPELWRYQVVQWEGQRYALTRLGFGLNSAPRALKVILNEVLRGHDVDAYRDDICVGIVESVDESRMKLQRALDDLTKAGFPSKGIVEVIPGALENPIRVLGLRVHTGEDGSLWWGRNLEIPKGQYDTLKELAGVIGKLAPGNLPRLRWARAWGQLLRSLVGREAGKDGWKRRASEPLKSLVAEFVRAVEREDPAKGRWSYSYQLSPGVERIWTVCCDASQDAQGVVIFAGDTCDPAAAVEDFSWLNPVARQINLLETDAVLNGLTEVLKYATAADKVVLKVDSKTTFAWVGKALNGEILRCKSMAGVLLTRRLNFISELAGEVGHVEIRWIPSGENPADELTRFPKHWVDLWRRPSEDRERSLEPKVIASIVGQRQPDQNLTDRLREWQTMARETIIARGTVEVNGLLCLEHGSRRGTFLPVVPSEFTTQFVRARHEELGHLGVTGLWYTIREEASFPDGGLAEAIREVIRTCNVCGRKTSTTYSGSGGTLWGRYPWDEVFMDCLSLPGDKYRGIIATIDGFSRFAEVKMVEAFSARSTVDFLEELRGRYGVPKVLRTDHGREFDNVILAEWCKRHGVKLQFSSVANPRSQGPVERFNRTLLSILRAQAAEQMRPWFEIIAQSLAIYNSRPHQGLGYVPPRDVFLGKRSRDGTAQIDEDLVEPDEIAEIYKELDWEYEEHTWEPKFSTGEPVYIRRQRPKDQFDWVPASVAGVDRRRSYVVQTEGGRQTTAHESNIKSRTLGGEVSMQKVPEDGERSGFVTPMEGESPGQPVEDEEVVHVVQEETVTNPTENFVDEISEREVRRSRRSRKPVDRLNL